ncbi:MAG: 50S ribosomal protein L11 methyltransferase [Vicinamibacterales bacterium]
MLYPALEVSGVDGDLVAALVDDFSPTAAEQRDDLTTVFFADAASRDLAASALALQCPDAALRSREVDDEDWARRSQENLTPITVGRVTVTPPWHALSGPATAEHDGHIQIVIAPSMGFGTGHHSTTRLCLAALQTLDLCGRRVVDIGTGSGVLAIAARALGAAEAVGLDCDADAIQAANENLGANPHIDHTRMVVGDLRTTHLSPADVVLANLTGSLLAQSAGLLVAAARPGGTLILSGLLMHERDEVVSAFGPQAALLSETAEEGWMCLTFNRMVETRV